MTDNVHGLLVKVQASHSNRYAEREVAVTMLADVAQSSKRIIVGAGKAYVRQAQLRQGLP